MSTISTASTESTAATITVIYVESPDDLYCRYRGQTSSQPCYVQLDCEEGVITVSYSPHIGGGRSLAEHHRRALRWSVPVLTVDAANSLLDELAPLAERVFLGYSTRWDGHNRIGVLDADARDAADAIAELCERDWREHEVQRRWEAGDWYADSRRELVASTGLSAETTDEQLAAIVAAEERRALDDGFIVDGVAAYMEWLRDELREEAAEADEDAAEDAAEDEQSGTYAIVDGEQIEMSDEDTCPACDGGIRWNGMYLRGNRCEDGRCGCADWRREERGDEWAYTATSRQNA